MAKRYSGNVSGTVTYRDPKPGGRSHNGDYRVTLRLPRGLKETVYVGAPAYLTHAVDSAQAYDEAFHAALSFAEQSGFTDEAEYKRDGSGYRITRTRRK